MPSWLWRHTEILYLFVAWHANINNFHLIFILKDLILLILNAFLLSFHGKNNWKKLHAIVSMIFLIQLNWVIWSIFEGLSNIIFKLMTIDTVVLMQLQSKALSDVQTQFLTCEICYELANWTNKILNRHPKKFLDGETLFSICSFLSLKICDFLLGDYAFVYFKYSNMSSMI